MDERSEELKAPSDRRDNNRGPQASIDCVPHLCIYELHLSRLQLYPTQKLLCLLLRLQLHRTS